MPDFATSDDPRVQAQLDRLALLSPGADVLGLERISALLARLDNPERSLPPVFHVAGTNGKGSTCAFLRAAMEASGLKVHVFTSPHLVRFNERIRLAGTLIEDAHLAGLLDEVLAVASGISPSFFEVTTAAAFLAFARTPADACIVEVGLGGRLDATNVLPSPAVCGIAQLGLDHQAFLGDRIEQVAAEKAGIAKAGVPLVTQPYPPNVAEPIRQAAARADALWLPRGETWDAEVRGGHLFYRDEGGEFGLPLPRLAGAHQAMNAALAVAMIRHQDRVAVPFQALEAAMHGAQWPARLQRLGPGPLHDLLPIGTELWLDGGHNPAAARAIADHFASRPLHIVLGLLANKDASGVLTAFQGKEAIFYTVPVPGHEHHAPETLAGLAAQAGFRAEPAKDVAEALGRIAAEGDTDPVLIMGSLYLAGTVLKANSEAPV
ncbi:bifunctional folylpolyglutamate synthase/dihydrofolate synthase [Allosphingosinicella flava]|uniref:Dihydrofolate synthase/folylpolyglutamate synthase n=1 Tax=Allosphingosinicella flava TaxID=2771430 RepID=A0A7T2GKI7_9SPHN|nr:folylpolyglutamate synthase/dihydrofolate synthase family protein [Sphingosinicella flava]QPQ55472.1 bifunctional folylpolyglutamate synthase/dihydrofolate synthase [Sphingosinicella flava]